MVHSDLFFCFLFAIIIFKYGKSYLYIRFAENGRHTNVTSMLHQNEIFFKKVMVFDKFYIFLKKQNIFFIFLIRFCSVFLLIMFLRKNPFLFLQTLIPFYHFVKFLTPLSFYKSFVNYIND